MNTCIGVVCDELGLASTRVLEQRALRPELRFKAWSTPSSRVSAVQNDRIPVDLEHDPTRVVGEVVHLERDANGNLFCVAHVDADVVPAVRVRVGSDLVIVPTDLYWSCRRWDTEDGIFFDSIALTASPARVSPRPVVFLPGQLDHRQAADRWRSQLQRREHELLTRAAHAHLDRRRDKGPLIVHGMGPQPAQRGLEPPAGPLRIRSAVQLGVSTSKREIELIVVPYETPTLVPYEGRMITEVIARGAFNGIERQTNQIRVNRDHSASRTCGRAIALHPHRREGLVAEIRIARTPLGDETLTLAEEGCLDCSAGFLPEAGGEKWETRNRCRITRAWLGHIALTPEPAYESARVLAVRGHGVG